MRAKGVGRLFESWSSFTYIKKNLVIAHSKEITKWHKTKTQERKASCYCYYVFWTKSNFSPILGNALKKYVSWYYQLKVGHRVFETFLAKISVMNAGVVEK